MSDIINDITEVIGTVADKAKEYGGYAKLQALIVSEEAKKREQYYRLGKKYYEIYKDAPASDLSDIVGNIVAMDEKISEYKEQLKKAEAESEAEGYTDVDVVSPEAPAQETEVTEEAPEATEEEEE